MKTEQLIETARWMWPLMIAPILGWISGRIAASRNTKRTKKTLIRYLAGLPPEMKSKLINFHNHRTHTLRGDPGSPAMQWLVQHRLVSVGTGGGTYDAIDCYLSIRPDIWEVMDDWVSIELAAIVAEEQSLEK